MLFRSSLPISLCPTLFYSFSSSLSPSLLFSLFVSLKDTQAEAPAHIQRLRVEAEHGRAWAVLQECRAELAREAQALTATSSERIIREHRVRGREREERGRERERERGKREGERESEKREGDLLTDSVKYSITLCSLDISVLDVLQRARPSGCL